MDRADSIFAQLMAVIEDRKRNPAGEIVHDPAVRRRRVERSAPRSSRKRPKSSRPPAEPGEAGRTHTVHEAADLIYHLFVMLGHRDISLAEVEAELARRFGISGLDEKASRARSKPPTDHRVPATSTTRHNLRIGIPSKGRLADVAAELLKEAGLSFRRQERSLFARCREMPIDVTFLRTEDIPVLCAEGAIDMGITGGDLVAESGVELANAARPGRRPVPAGGLRARRQPHHQPRRARRLPRSPPAFRTSPSRFCRSTAPRPTWSTCPARSKS